MQIFNLIPALCIIYFFRVDGYESSDGGIISFTGPKYPVREGDKAVFRCEFLKDPKLDVMIRKITDIYHEKCNTFRESNKIECYNHSKSHEYVLTIGNVTLKDKGVWRCLNGTKYKEHYLQLYHLKETSIEIKAKKKTPLSKYIKTRSYPLNRIEYQILTGRGSRKFPIDLYNVDNVEITCTSLCGYPRFEHYISLKNSTSDSINISYSDLKNYNQSCDNNEFQTIISKTIFSCTDSKLSGLINVTCFSYYPGYRDEVIASRAGVFVLCPSQQIELPILLFGEKVNLVIGCLIAFTLLILFSIILTNWRSSSYKEGDDNCHTALFTDVDDNGNKIMKGYRV